MTVTLDLSPSAVREIASACERLSLDYAHYADNGGTAAWARLFAVDGELHLFGQVHRGRAAIEGDQNRGESEQSGKDREDRRNTQKDGNPRLNPGGKDPDQHLLCRHEYLI